MPRRATIRLSLLLATTMLTAPLSGTAFAACLESPANTFICFAANGPTSIVRGGPVTVFLGDVALGPATFSGQLAVRSNDAVTITAYPTVPPSSFWSVNGVGGIEVVQTSSNGGDIRITGLNTPIRDASVGIWVGSYTTGTTIIETVAGGTIVGDGGIYYQNRHATPGAATITIGAAITAGANSAVRVETLSGTATNTLNLNANVTGRIQFSDGGSSTAILNVASGVQVSSGGMIIFEGGASATVNNAGIITATGNQNAIETDTVPIVTINNNSGGAISAASTGWVFYAVGSGDLTLANNAGATITGSGFSSSGTTVTIDNAGIWTVNRDSAFHSTATLFNSGTFNSGAFTTALTSASNSGTVNVEAGGTLNTSGSYAQSAGTTAIATGATLVATGGYSQSGGTATVDGTLASAVTLTGGTLGGSGTIVGNLSANAGGTVSPGNSVGTLTVNGNVSFVAGSTYRVEIVGANADLLTVSGTASLAGTLRLIAGGGSYSFNTAYTVLTAAGGRSGSFGNVITSGSFGIGVSSEVSYGGNDVRVTLKPGSLVDAGSNGGQSNTGQSTTPSDATTTTNPVGPPSANPTYSTASGLSLNGWSVAAAIDRAVANGADPSFLYQIYARGDRQALIAALGTLTGEVHASVGMLGWEAAGGFLRAMLDPFAVGRDPNAMPGAAGAFATAGAYASSGSQAELPSAKGLRIAPQFGPERRYNLWGQAFGSTSRSGADIARGSHASDGSSGHLALGIDVHVLPETVLGLAIAAGESRANLSGALGDAKAEILQAGLYGMTRIGALSLGAALGYASAEVETSRAIPLIGAFAIRGKYRAEIWSGRAEAAWRLAAFGPLSVSPYAAFTAQNLRIPGFLERDGVSGLPSGLAVQGRDGSTARAELGLRLDAAATLFGLQTSAFGKLGWGYYARRDNQFGASLIGLPGASFSFQGTRPDRNAALIATGLDVRLSTAVSLGARFDAELSQNNQSYAGSATLKVRF